MKISKELKPFNGMDSAYRIWPNRIEDHFAEKSPDWLLIFNAIEKHKEAIGRELLRTITIPGDGYVLDIDFRLVSNALWTFIGKHLVDSIYSNRNTWEVEIMVSSFGDLCLLNMREGPIK